ncbi:ABC transporter permease [Catellatospora methionotrophica]|uniref:ABC transporter permease n=1 Tax=Catellatospora methionotrophica TaxID=121620 RepID=UPI0033D761A4
MTSLTGTGTLIRLILRRDRVLMPIWMLCMALLPVGLASGTASLYPTDAGRQGYIDSLASSPLLVLFYGPKPAEPSLGALIFWRSATGIVIMGLIALLVVIRHTRVEEEAGRRELLGSTVVGRHAALAAAVLTVSGASLVVGVLVALGMISQQTPAPGAFAMGLAWAFAGILYAAIGALAAQLTTGAGAARGIAGALLGLDFLLRGTGDVAGGGLSWLSWSTPLSWVYQVHAYTGDRWWLFALTTAVALALVLVALRLSAARDVGAGLLPPRLGPAQAPATLRSPLGLAWRLHRGSLIGWTIGLGVIGGVLFGGVAKTASSLLEGNGQLTEIMERLGGKSVASDIFIGGSLGIGAIAVAAYAVSAALRMRTEEAALRSEPVLAAGVGRLRWAAGHLVFALLGPTVVMAVTGLFAGLVYGASTGEVGRQVVRVVGAALVQMPAVWVLTGLTVAAYGLLPRLSPAVGWAALAACVLLGQVGAALNLGQSVLDLSPFSHIPHLPGPAAVPLTPLIILTAIAAALTALGLAALRRRDIPVT